MGFILAAVGSAVGLGNIWRFPFMVGQQGGAAFVLVYLLFVAAIGFPAILVEFVIGRKTERNPVGALQRLGSGLWKYVGWLFVATGFVILSYYSAVAGWFIRYFVVGITDGYANALAEYEADAAGADASASELMFGDLVVGLDSLLLHAIFMIAVIVVIALGIRSGIELAVKFMVPTIIALLVVLAAYGATLDGAAQAYSYYLSPDFGVILSDWANILPAAAGQAFFTLSLGMGVMITYASYLGEDRNLAKDGLTIIGFDTGIALLTGLVAFPFIFAGGSDPGQMAEGAIFYSLTEAFAEIPAGRPLGILFFGTVVFAALSSAISILEVLASYLIDEKGFDRVTAALVTGGAVFVIGIPVTQDLVFLGLLDGLAYGVLLVLGSLLLAVFVGWVMPDLAREELRKGISVVGNRDEVWIWLVRIPIIAVLVVTLALGIVDYYGFLTEDFASWLSAL